MPRYPENKTSEDLCNHPENFTDETVPLLLTHTLCTHDRQAGMMFRFVPALADCFTALPRSIVYTAKACGAVAGSCSIARPGDKLDKALWLLWIMMFGVLAGSIIVRRWGA